MLEESALTEGNRIILLNPPANNVTSLEDTSYSTQNTYLHEDDTADTRSVNENSIPFHADEEVSKTVEDYLDEQLGELKYKVSINKYESAESVNDWWSSKGYDKPPYTLKTVVQDIRLNEDTVFVRVYDNDVSSLKGGWVMKPEDIKGLTPLQIQDKFALPSTPKYIGEVKIRAGNNLRMGKVNPNYGFQGGGIQFDLKGQYIGEFKEIGDLVDWGLEK